MIESGCITYQELVLLKVLADNGGVRQRDLIPDKFGYSVYNQFLKEKNIGIRRVTPISGGRHVVERVSSLRNAGLLVPEGSYEVTEKGYDVLKRLGADIQKWPHKIPYDAAGRLQWSKASNFPSYRGRAASA